MSGALHGSGTALVLAASQVRQRHGPGALLARACLRESGTAGRRWLSLADTRLGRWGLALLERLAIPGLAAHYRWRKRHIARWAREAVRDGATQVVLLGPGHDALGVRLGRKRGVDSVIEIDREPVMVAKWRALRALGLDRPSLLLLSCDLSNGLGNAALDGLPGFDPDAPTLVVAEGVLMYLGRREVARIDAQLRQLLRGPITLIGTSMAPRPDGTPGFAQQSRWVDRWLARRGERFQWCAPVADLVAALAAAGWRNVQFADPTSPADPDPCPGELAWRATLPGLRAARRPASRRPRSTAR